MTLANFKEQALKNPEVKAEYDRLGNTLTEHKLKTRKTWARIAAEIAEHAKANDPDKMEEFYEGRLYAIRGGKPAKSWETKALYDYLGEGATFD